MADETADQIEDTPEAAVEDVQPTASADAEAVVGEEEPSVSPELAAETLDEPVPDAKGAPEPAAESEQPVADGDEVETPAPTDEVVSDDEATAGVPAAPRRKKKRRPRVLRPKRTKSKRETPKERKPITRLPKPEHVRGRRLERQGTVVSAAADKTIVVRVDVVKAHPMYKKVIRRSTKLHAHDEDNRAKVGDIVRIVETRPISRRKRWRLHQIVEAAK